MARTQRPSQKVSIYDPFSNELVEAPTTDFEENSRRLKRNTLKKEKPTKEKSDE